jgi:titin
VEVFSSPPTTQTISGLTNGTAYTFTVAAINANGVGQASARSISVIPSTIAGAPTIGAVAASNASASVSWTAPSSDGGSVITGYVVTPYIGSTAKTAQTFSSAATTETVTGLTNGTAYTFTVAAINGVGTGARSAVSNSVTPSTVPGAPTIGAASSSNASASLSWTAPSSDGGSAIIGYVVTPYIGSTAEAVQVFSSPPTTQTVTGLTNGTAYTFTVAAMNANGVGQASASSSPVVPSTVPSAPTTGSVTAGNASASVSWTAPSSNGGSAITGYVVTPYVGSTAQTAQTFVSTATTQTVTGLTNGTAYSFTVAAINVVGTGAQSAASSSVTPSTVPGAPTIGTATTGNASASVSWTAPSSDGGSAITGYVVTPYVGTLAQSAQTFSSTATAQTVTGLTNGTTYTFVVAAVNALGIGAESAASNPMTPATVPGAPTIGTVAASNASASVSWTAPSSDGGSAITGYVVTPYVGSTAQTAQTFVSTATTQTVTGLTNGTTYTFVVAAVNAVGIGAESAASNPMTPATVPGAPTIVTATPANASATVSWTAPSSDGGSPVTGYAVVATDTTTPANGGQTCTWTTGSLTCTVSGLTNGDTYTFAAQASNVVGASVPSAAFGPVIPPSGDWTESAPALAPSPRATSSEAWDPATGQLILFGGGACSGSGGGCTVTNDTWSWTGTTWTSLAPSSSPPPLAEASLAYDPAAGQLVLFGGIGSSGSSLSGTWIWNGSNWLQESPSSSPPARHGASLGYDPNTDQLILYGGSAAAGITPMASDTWAWNGTDWEQLTPSTSPPPLYAATMAWDSSTGQLILFGGTTNGTYNGTNETWAWTGSNWSELFPASSPPARLRATMAMDPSSGQLLLFGGYGIGQVDLGDMWAWNGSSWMQLTPPTLPTSRADASMAFDSATGTIVLFGGSILEGEQLLGDTWLYP